MSRNSFRSDQEERKTLFIEKEENNAKSKKKFNQIRDKSLTAFYPSNIDTQPSSHYSQLKQNIKSVEDDIAEIKKAIPSYEKKLKQVKQNTANEKGKCLKLMSIILNEEYEKKRKQKQVRNEAIGKYIFSVHSPTPIYQQGSIFVQIVKQHLEIKELLDKIKEDKNNRQKQGRKSRNRQSNELQDFKQSIYTRALYDIQEKWRKFKTQKQIQKMKAKLAFKQANSYFAKLNWPVIKNRYVTLELIGTGGFGSVFKIFDTITLQFYALKLTFPDPDDEESIQEDFIKHAVREQQVHRKLDHKNIAKVYDTIELENQEQNVLATIIELCQGPDLSQYIKQHKNLEEKEAKYVIKQVLEALLYMNKLNQKIIHYDLKPQNILMNRGEIKVIDFGLCKVMEEHEEEIQLTSMGTGTSWYLPPETFETILDQKQETSNDIKYVEDEKIRKVSSKIDIWSIGVIFYQFLYGTKPFYDNISQQQIWDKGLMKKVQNVEFPNSKNVSQKAKDFIKLCLKPNPMQRLQVKNALSHPYFA